MKYVFFGTPRFGAIVLKGLLAAGMAPAALVCNPDRPVGRKKVMTPPATKELLKAVGAATEILQPEKLDAALIEHLWSIGPDLFVVAAYAKIIPKEILAVPRLGTLGVHPSLLPHYRGASPIQSVILNGESETGTTIYQMDEKMDHGPIFGSAAIPLDALATGYLALEEQLAKLGAGLLVKLMPEVLAGTGPPKPQDENTATFTKKFTTDDGFIEDAAVRAAEAGDKTKAAMIVRMINAFNPEPGAWTLRDGKRVKLLTARLADGALELDMVQEEGGTPKPYRIS